MKILSWNILANEFIKKRYYPMIPPDILINRKNRQNQIIITLRQTNADVMLLQEVMQSEYNLLVHYFGKTHHIIRGKYISWQNKRSSSGNVTLLRKQSFGLPANFLINLKFGLIVQCYLKSGSSTQPIIIINVHLDDISHANRIDEIKELEPNINSIPNVILGGDFNEIYKADSTLYKSIKSMGLKIFNNKPSYYVERPMCIDNIMLKGPIAKNKSSVILNVAGTDIVSQYLTYGSDHLPVVVY
jgi:hypothetical protein